MERSDFKRRCSWGFKMVGWVILGAILAAGFAFLFGYFVMLLWNWLMPELFGLATITFWKAFGIILLARLIFGGFKHNGHSRSKSKYDERRFAKHWHKEYWDKGSVKDCRYFKDYWKEEGKKSFEDYVEKRKSE